MSMCFEIVRWVTDFFFKFRIFMNPENRSRILQTGAFQVQFSQFQFQIYFFITDLNWKFILLKKIGLTEIVSDFVFSIYLVSAFHFPSFHLIFSVVILCFFFSFLSVSISTAHLWDWIKYLYYSYQKKLCLTGNHFNFSFQRVSFGSIGLNFSPIPVLFH